FVWLAWSGLFRTDYMTLAAAVSSSTAAAAASAAMVTGSPFAAHPVEALGEAAFFHEAFSQCGYLPVEEGARHRQQRQCAICRDFSISGHRGLCGPCGLRFTL